MRLGGSVVTCAPLTTTVQGRFQVSCLHPSQPMPSGFPSVAFFWLQIVISPSVMQSIGREKNLVKKSSIYLQMLTRYLWSEVGRGGLGEVFKFRISQRQPWFWIWAPHLNPLPPPPNWTRFGTSHGVLGDIKNTGLTLSCLFCKSNISHWNRHKILL